MDYTLLTTQKLFNSIHIKKTESERTPKIDFSVVKNSTGSYEYFASLMHIQWYSVYLFKLYQYTLNL